MIIDNGDRNRAKLLPGVLLWVRRRIPGLDVVSSKLDRSRTTGMDSRTRIIRPNGADFEGLVLWGKNQYGKIALTK